MYLDQWCLNWFLVIGLISISFLLFSIHSLCSWFLLLSFNLFLTFLVLMQHLSYSIFSLLFSSGQLLSHIWLCDPMDCRRRLSFTNSRSLLKRMSIESAMPSNHLILCCPLLRLPSIFPSIRVFSSESALHIRWPKDWSFSFSISPSNEYSGLIPLGLIGLVSMQSKGLSRVFSSTTVQKHQFFSSQLSSQSNSYIHKNLIYFLINKTVNVLANITPLHYQHI